MAQHVLLRSGNSRNDVMTIITSVTFLQNLSSLLAFWRRCIALPVHLCNSFVHIE